MATESFFWDETRATLTALGARHPLRLDEKRRAFEAPGIVVAPPMVFPIPQDVDDLAAYVEGLPPAPGRHVVILLQAGAASLGVFDGGENVVTKSIKRYVVRGSGRAQPTHLKTRGKSRYGSRLRLQNARKLLIEVNERLTSWFDEYGPPEHVYFNAPVRLWPDLFEAKVPPPFDRRDAIKIPLDLPVPTTDVLLRTYRRMSFGRVSSG